jgi:WD40 repeat protein
MLKCDGVSSVPRRMRRSMRMKVPAAATIAMAFCVSPAIGSDFLSSLKDRVTGDGNSVKVARKIAQFKDSFNVGGLTFSADGMKIATSGMVAPPEVHVWSWKDSSGRYQTLAMPDFAGSGKGVSFSPNGLLLAAAHSVPFRKNPGSDSDPRTTIQVWNAKSETAVQDIDIKRPDVGGMGDLIFTSDSKSIVAIEERAKGAIVTAFSTESWQREWDIDLGPLDALAMALSPDGQYIAIGVVRFEFKKGLPTIKHPVLQIVSLQTRQVVRTIEGVFPDQNEIRSISWSSDGQYLAAGGVVQGTFPGPNALRVFDTASGKPVVDEPSRDSADVTGLAYTSDGRYLVEGIIDGAVRIWDAMHKELYQKISVEDDQYLALAVSKDGKYFAIGSGRDVSIFELKQ